jgi:hypothetical protein
MSIDRRDPGDGRVLQLLLYIGADGSAYGKAAAQIAPPDPKGLGADSEEKREPVSDMDTEAADSLKALDPKRPVREADMTGRTCCWHV